MKGTHYNRREEQPSSANFRTREYVDCLLCGVPSDSDDEPPTRNRSSKLQAKKGIRLDTLMRHYKKKHKDVFHVEGMNLLDMGFSITRAIESSEANGDVHITSEAEMEDASEFSIDTETETITSRTEQTPVRLGVSLPIPPATAQNIM